MNKATTKEVMNVYADCLRTVYKRLGLTVPEEFDPATESARIVDALQSQAGYHLAYLDKAINALSYIDDAKTRSNYAIGIFNDHILPKLENK